MRAASWQSENSISSKSDVLCIVISEGGTSCINCTEHQAVLRAEMIVNNHVSYHIVYTDLRVVPGQAGGGSFRVESINKAKKEFADRMRAGPPTSAVPKPSFCVNQPGPSGAVL